MRRLRRHTLALSLLWAFMLTAGPGRAADDEDVLMRTTEMGALFEQEAHAEWEAIKTGIMSSFAIPVHELYEHRNKTWWEAVKHGWSATTSISVPLTALDVQDQGEGSQGTRVGSAPALIQSFSYNPIGNWKGSISFFVRLTERKNQPWEGDFTYSFGYSDWRPYTLSLTYANYGGNKFDPDRGQRASDFIKGAITLGWKFPIHPSVFKYFALTPSSSMGCNTGYSLTPVWSGLNTNGDQHLKHRLSFGCKYTIWKNLFVNFSMNYYPVEDQQQPWDPDYTYGFGWFDWRKGTVSVQYSNIGGTRYPWRRQPSGAGQFQNGSISISYGWKF